MDNIYSAFHYLQKCIKEVFKAKQHAEEAKQYAEEAKQSAESSGRATITYWDE
jgi:histone H3/H4